MQETWFDPWARKIPLEDMATHSSVPAWRIPWTEEPGGLQPMAHSHSVSDTECRLPWAPLVAETVKTLPATQETWVQLLGQEDPLGKEMAIHCSILAWRIPSTAEPGGLQSTGLQRVGHN